MKRICIFGSEEKFVNYREAVLGVGGAPLFSESPEAEPLCAGLILTGGGDLDPALYGQENRGSVGIDRALDERELRVTEAFVRAGKPILGICRGHQLLNVAFGGGLIQDLPTASAHRWEESTGDKVHPVTAEAGFLRRLYGPRFSVNSAHHQAADRPAPGFSAAALSDDGTVEAMAWPEKRIYAVQFHPERMCFAHRRPDTVDGSLIFRFFLDLCAEPDAAP